MVPLPGKKLGGKVYCGLGNNFICLVPNKIKNLAEMDVERFFPDKLCLCEFFAFFVAMKKASNFV